MYILTEIEHLFFPFLQGSAAQEPILQSARSMLDSSTHLLKTARSLVINPKDPPMWSVLAGHSRTVSDSIKGLITAIRLVNEHPVGFYKLNAKDLAKLTLCKGFPFKEQFDILGDGYIRVLADG